MYWIDPQPAQSQRTNLTVLFDKCSFYNLVWARFSVRAIVPFSDQHGACKNQFRFLKVKCNEHFEG